MDDNDGHIAVMESNKFQAAEIADIPAALSADPQTMVKLDKSIAL